MSMPDSRAQTQGASGTVIDAGDVADGDGNGRSIEYLYAVDFCRGSLDCFTAHLDHPVTPQEHWAGHLVRFRITHKTPRRVFFENHRGRIQSVDRQTIEATGEIYRGGSHFGAPDSHLYLAEPPMPKHWIGMAKATATTGGAA